MLLLAEKILILALNSKKGDVNPEHENLLRFGLPAATLMDLCFLDRLTLKKEKLIIKDQKKTGMEPLDTVLNVLQEEEKEKSLEYYVDTLATYYRELKQLTFESLIKKHILKKEKKKILWIFPVTKYKFEEIDHKIELIHHLQQTLVDEGHETDDSIALIAILNSCRSIDLLLREGYNPKMEEIINEMIDEEHVGEVVSKLIKTREEILATIYALSATYQANI